MVELNLRNSHPVVAKAESAGVTDFEFCRDICPGDGSGCNQESRNVMEIFKQLVDRVLKKKVFQCKKNTE